MADNFDFTPGSGKTGAADDIGGVLYPRVKVTWGADGTANDADTASGKALPVQLRDSTGTEVVPLTATDFDTKIGSLTETAPTTDTASSGLNGRLQRIAQRITSLIALVPAALTGSGNFKVSLQESNASQAVTAASLPLPTGAATETTLGTLVNTTDFDGKIGALTETAPASDTASSGLNGRLQRIAQRLSSLIALVPAALTGSGNFKVALVEDTTTNKSMNVAQINGVTPLMGNGTAGTGALRVTLASDNTANSNPFLVSIRPETANGPTLARVKAAATTNATSVKASAGQIYGYALFNNTSSAKFFKVYNKASAPTVGTDTPAFTIIIPASGGANVSWPNGIPLGTGIAYAITGAVGDSDTTALAADDVHGLLLYK